MSKTTAYVCPRCGGQCSAPSGARIYCGCGDHHTLMQTRRELGSDAERRWLRLPTYEEYARA